MNQINVVPYIDVMLVLLVIFMVTAPLINPGQIELPSVGKTSDPPQQPMEVTVQGDGALLLRDRARSAQERKVTRNEVEEMLAECLTLVKAGLPPRAVKVRAVRDRSSVAKAVTGSPCIIISWLITWAAIQW